MPDPEVRYGRIREESRLNAQGAEEVWIVVPIWIGDHGPFTERLTKAEYTDGFTLAARVDAFKATLRALPK